MKKLLVLLCLAVLPAALLNAQIYTGEVQVINGLGGSVGINASSPQVKLDIGSTHGNGLQFRFDQSTSYRIRLTPYWTSNADTRLDFNLERSAGVGFTTVMSVGYNNNVGIGTTTPSQKLSVNGNASKATAGDWLANSDARLKTNISPLHSEETLQKMLRLQGVTYEWNDDKTGLDRPTGIQYGFTAQNIQEVFPSLVEEDDLGYLQSSYSTYDAMLVESIRALNEKIEGLERENDGLRASLNSIDAQLQRINALLPPLGIKNTGQLKSELK